MISSAVAAYAKKEEVYAFQTLYRELGYYISRLEQYQRALKFFDLSLSKTPNDQRALLGRAWARSKACHYEGALEDIRTALGLDPDDIVMLSQKALNTYLSGEFESGLVQNLRLIPRRKKPDCFQMGAMHCADAIENCLGERAGRPLRDHYLIIRKLAWKKNFEKQKRFQSKNRNKKKKKKKKQAGPIPSDNGALHKKGVPTVSSSTYTPVADKSKSDRCSITNSIYSKKSEQNIDPPPIKFPYKPLQRYTTNIENYMAEKYLDCMYKDKIFLKNLAKNPGIKCPNAEGTAKILDLAKTGYKAVKYKQELLRERRPFYFIKYQEATSSGALKSRQEQELIKIKTATKKEADYIASKMKEALDNKKWRTVLDLAEKLHFFCIQKPKKLLPAREEYMELIYETVCQAHFDLKRLNPEQNKWEQESRIYKLLGIPLEREPSKDSVVAEFKGLFIDWKKQISVYNDRLRKASSSKELCWLFHELSRFHIELKQYHLGRIYARKCINEAKHIRKNKWVINGLMLMIRINIAHQSKNDAKAETNEAIRVANQMNNSKLVEFFKKCLAVIEKISYDAKPSNKVLLQREQKILEMMGSDKMKDEAAHLFMMMAAMPAARRMSVMPGIRVTDDPNTKGSTKRTSIRPTDQKPDYSLPLSVEDETANVEKMKFFLAD